MNKRSTLSKERQFLIRLSGNQSQPVTCRGGTSGLYGLELDCIHFIEVHFLNSWNISVVFEQSFCCGVNSFVGASVLKAWPQIPTGSSAPITSTHQRLARGLGWLSSDFAACFDRPLRAHAVTISCRLKGNPCLLHPDLACLGVREQRLQ